MDLHTSESALQDEIALLQAMYPDEARYDMKGSLLSFKHSDGEIELRLPDNYPSSSLPGLLAATGPKKRDLRGEANQILVNQQIGEPCLDSIITQFVALIEGLPAEDTEVGTTISRSKSTSQSKTAIIWLHHLLATSKRKQALCPQNSGASHISGITKPGYPGVMIFSGPADAVDAHVQALKQLRWQAFQIRCETEDSWSFEHGQGIIEVESMAEIVSDLEGFAEQRVVFMEAMKIK